jgi:hypothetical protein
MTGSPLEGNRSGSCDARRYGFVPFSDLVGKVIKIERPA